MGTRVLNCVDRVGDLEQDNAATIDEGQLALAGCQFIDCPNLYLT